MSGLLNITDLMFFGSLSIGSAALAVFLGKKEYSKEYYAAARGSEGEKRVARLLAKHGAKAIHDLTILIGGRTHQLDHIVAAQNRLIVIETKTWTGTISGRLADTHWYLTRPRKPPVKAYNPFFQNATHAEALAALAGVPVQPLVVSAGHARAIPEIEQAIVPLRGLAALLDVPGFISPQIEAAFARLSALKAEPRQGRLAAQHRGAVSRRYGGSLSRLCWIVSAVSLAMVLAAALQASQG